LRKRARRPAAAGTFPALVQPCPGVENKERAPGDRRARARPQAPPGYGRRRERSGPDLPDRGLDRHRTSLHSQRSSWPAVWWLARWVRAAPPATRTVRSPSNGGLLNAPPLQTAAPPGA
jgi:hypothetical protein